ncbi:MAG: EamA family transporter [Hyphomicrobiales bacterium]|nr:MAG: EamA family transporter [Hyphomicrobiales bacterium]
MQNSKYLLALLVLGLLWGASIPLAKIVVSTGHPPLGLVFWQLVLGVVVLASIAFFRKSNTSFRRRHVLFFTLVILFGTIFPDVLSFWILTHLPSGVVALAIATAPMFSLIIALKIGTEKFSFTRIIGLLLGALSVTMLILPETSLPDSSKAIFVLLALLVPLSYSVEGNYLSVAQPQEFGPVATLLGASIAGLFIVLPLTLATGSFINPLELQYGVPEIALLATTLMHVAAYVGYIWLVAKAGAVFSAQIGYVVTISGVILSVILLGENHSAWLWAALALMVLALALVRPKKKPADDAITTG